MLSALVISALSVIVCLIALGIVWFAWINHLTSRAHHEAGRHKKHVHKSVHNPVMSPVAVNDWEAAGTFNPAVIQDKKGIVHMLYRALGADGVSRIGYANSKDGLHISERLTYPVYVMRSPRDNPFLPKQELEKQFMRPDPVMYPSGGSWGGSEDPRLVEIDGMIYMTFNAFDGWDFIRIAAVKIKADDFYHHRFKWSDPMFISPPGEINKNWVLFPEKIDGKFAILHSITPDVQVEYVKRLEELDWGARRIKSIFKQRKFSKTWDSHIRGAGPPPVKTDRGWLVLYHAADKKDPHIGYKLGALLLDLHDPRKILARAPQPIMTPDEWYENDWKPGVVYACGATVKDGLLYVYYGGGDKHVCIAQAPLHELVDWLLEYGKVS